MGFHTNHADRHKSDARVGRRIRYSYRAALSIIAAISLTFFFIERRSLKQFDGIATIINTSGQQRMLSQRSALYAQMLVHSSDEAANAPVIEELRRLREKIASNHALIMDMGLPYGTDDDSLSDGALKVYYGGKHNLNEQLRTFLIDMDRLLTSVPEERVKAAADIKKAAMAPLLNALDAAVTQFESDAKESVVATTRLQVLMLIAVFMVLLAELMLIFRPLVNRIEKGTRELLEARDEMRHAALHDALTGLPNRRLLQSIMENTAAVAKRRNETMIVCHMDLDFFKEINDTKGHAVGDAVLCHAASILRDAVRDSDFIARVGGDEFVLVDCSLGCAEGALEMAERIINRISEPFEIDGEVCQIGASIGIAEHPTGATNLETVLHHADIALYRAKEMGRGRAELYSAEAQEGFDNRSQDAA